MLLIAAMAAPTSTAAAASDPAARYVESVWGYWREAEAGCDDVVGTWAFSDRMLRGDATLFDILRVTTVDPSGLWIDARHRNSGRVMRLAVTSTGDRLRIRTAGLSAELLRCPIPDA